MIDDLTLVGNIQIDTSSPAGLNSNAALAKFHGCGRLTAGLGTGSATAGRRLRGGRRRLRRLARRSLGSDGRVGLRFQILAGVEA